MSNSRLAHFSAGRVILFALFGTILVGTALLSLPIARIKPLAFIDLFFTATSATCVTGLFTIPLDQFTFFGHCVILGLIQIGGLGVITLTLFVLSLFVNLGLATQLMAGKLLELESWKNIRNLLFFIVVITFITELIGAICFFFTFIKIYTPSHSIFLSIFHSVSFFCNAGITLFGNNQQIYAHNYALIIISTMLMFLGGLGFVTLYESFEYFSDWKSTKPHHFSLQSKIILYGALIGISVTALLVYFLEHNHAFILLSPVEKVLTSIFQAVAFRSTGLLTLPVANVHLATLFLIMVVGFIGSAPGSTGSGVRTTTMAIYLGVVKAAIEGHTNIFLMHRRIARDQINKAIAIISLSIFWVVITTFCLLVIEPNWRFLDVVFETVCAFTNLGLSTGITAYLSTLGKVLIILSMIFGRIGSLTLILALRKIAMRKEATPTEIMYPEERIMLS
jgi:trk system potassium uptake protein TrkH